MTKLRVGIVGASGWMAGALAAAVEYDFAGFDKAGRKGRRNPNSVVTALCGRDEAAIRSRKDELDLTEAEIFTSYDAMLACGRVDAVVVAVPNHLHAAFAAQCLAAGKHLFLEKPLTTGFEASKKLMALAAATDATTKIDYIMIHYDEQLNLKKLIGKGAFGELVSTHFTYRHPIQVGESAEQAWKLSKEKSGGAIPMGICHAIAATVFQVDSDPVSVICKSSPPRVRPFDYDTQQDILITFKNGVIGVVQGNIDFAEKYDARHTVIGTQGQFDYNPYNHLSNRISWSSGPMKRPYAPDPHFAQDHLDSGDVWKHKCAHTIEEFVALASKRQKDPLLGLESALVKRIEAVIWASEQSAHLQGASIDAKLFLSSFGSGTAPSEGVEKVRLGPERAR